MELGSTGDKVLKVLMQFSLSALPGHVSAVVNEMDHLDVANIGSWDIATRLHRSGKSRKEAGNSRHRMMLILGEPL